jgi:hypothetical protein
MTTHELEKELIAKFGPGGATATAYETYLHLRRGSIPKDLERVTPPGVKHVRFCPKAVSLWYNSGRIPGYYKNLV